MSDQTTFDINQVIAQAKAVITNPVGYYQTMPKTGGYGNPVIFVAVMGAVMGLITAVLSFFGSAAGMMAAGLGAIIVMPIFAVLGAFIGAAILYVIWKLMGSAESYETAFRCQASVAAIYPISALLARAPSSTRAVGRWIRSGSTTSRPPRNARRPGYRCQSCSHSGCASPMPPATIASGLCASTDSRLIRGASVATSAKTL